ncbi:hypothetical protein BJ166DRAFT_499698 [Pestalotiopsis sp. NC0098]|nr:hypothetical protein BJ166DRAFT_499698 [Pestalotiopsis sp. NC0098]
MEDYVSIIVAVISLVTSLLTAAVTAGIGPFVTSSVKKRKVRRESDELFQTYREKLFSAAGNLQLRIKDIITADRLTFHDKSPQHHEDLYVYTCFELGELLAWTDILKGRIETLPFTLEVKNPLHNFIILLHQIRGILIHDYDSAENEAFILWNGAQMAISELMTEKHGSAGKERICIGYLEFTKRWHANEACAEDRDSLRYWFGPVVAGLKILVEKGSDAPETYRLRRLQHLLVDLMMLMDPELTRLVTVTYGRCTPAPDCPCRQCRGIIGPDEHNKLSALQWKRVNITLPEKRKHESQPVAMIRV